MNEENKENLPNEKNKKGIKTKGSTQLSLKEYYELKEQAKKKSSKSFKVPTFVKILLYIPLLIIFLFGLFFIPYMLYGTLTSGSNSTSTQTK